MLRTLLSVAFMDCELEARERGEGAAGTSGVGLGRVSRREGQLNPRPLGEDDVSLTDKGHRLTVVGFLSRDIFHCIPSASEADVSPARNNSSCLPVHPERFHEQVVAQRELNLVLLSP